MRNFHGDTGKETKTCFDCVYGNYDKGSYPTREDPGEPESVECTQESVTACEDDTEMEQWLDANKHLEYYDIAQECSFFKPIMITECANCKKPMKAEQWSHKLWADVLYDSVPVCCEGCKNTLQEKAYNEMVEESTRDLIRDNNGAYSEDPNEGYADTQFKEVD